MTNPSFKGAARLRSLALTFVALSIALPPTSVPAAASASAGTRRAEYDFAGRPTRIVDPSGQVTTIARDLIGRPTSVQFPDGKLTTLRYDLKPFDRGYLSSFSDRSGGTDYTRDGFGRVVSKRQTLASGFAQQLGYTFADSGLLASIVYPDGSVLGHVYDRTGQLIRLDWNNAPLVTHITWNPMGQPTGWTWAFVSSPAGSGGLAARRSHDTAARLTETEFSSYRYDRAGRISLIAQQLHQPADADPTHATIATHMATWSPGYDPVGRITRFGATLKPDEATTFSYDPNGNRTASFKALNGFVTARSYAIEAGTNRASGFTQSVGATTTTVTYGYNGNGDLTSDGLRSFSYDAEGRLSAVTTGATDASPTTRYAHNALGQRVFKTEPLYPPAQGDEGSPGFMQSLVGFFTQLWGPSASDAERLGTAFMYDEKGSLLSETGTGGAHSTGSTQHIYLPTANGPMPIATLVNGQKFAVHSDHLNTPRRLTNEQGQPVWEWAYSAFGDNPPTTAKNRFADPDAAASPGTTNISVPEYNIGYWGMYRDRESGLFYNVNRSYSAERGTYTQNDPIGLAGGWNRKTYALNNPIRYSDALGLNPLAGAVGGAELGAVLGPAGSVVGALIGAGVGVWGGRAAGEWISGLVYAQPQTPTSGEPGSCHVNPGSGQERKYGGDGRPEYDIDWHADHGAGTPHGHNWDPSPDGGKSLGTRGPGVPLSPWPLGRGRRE